MSQARRKKLTRRNNVLILIVIMFILLLNTPQLIKKYIIKSKRVNDIILLLPKESSIVAINFPNSSIVKKEEVWQLINNQTSKDPKMFIEQWQSLQGTYVTPELFKSLKDQLSVPITIEIWLKDNKIPQRITVYEHHNKFIWLMNNWQSHWLAVTAKETYLFP